MPLFQFRTRATPPFPFGDSDLSIERLDSAQVVPRPVFSEQDIKFMKASSWALVYDGDDLSKYRTMANLLLLAFRVFRDCRSPFIKYRLCETNISENARINQAMTYNYGTTHPAAAFTARDIADVAVGFEHLCAMDSISIRTRNALYFLYRAFHSDKWIDSFLLMTSSLESLFSKDAAGGATETISMRVASLLGSTSRCTRNDVRRLYDVRSAMTHGRLAATDDPQENLSKLEHLEHVTTQCFRKLVHTEAYLSFASKAKRDAFMGTLNVAP